MVVFVSKSLYNLPEWHGFDERDSVNELVTGGVISWRLIHAWCRGERHSIPSRHYYKSTSRAFDLMVPRSMK